MERKIKKFLSELKSKNKKRFTLEELENYLISSYKGNTSYSTNGGYRELHNQINDFKRNNQIREIKSSKYNGLNPPLKIRWEIIFEEEISNWDKSKILQFSDRLDFSYYVNNPIYQTDLEWEFIENIYKFLISSEDREWTSVEERCLELFYDEKFILKRGDTPKGKYGILKRLKLEYDDLKMKKYGEMFIYWNRGTKDIKKVIILENHSTFFTYKNATETLGNIFGFEPDAIIFGEGKKIENSFSFIGEIANKRELEVLYFGDMDPEGLGIYYRLRDRYPDFHIRLQYDAYLHLIDLYKRDYLQDGQKKNPIFLECFLQDMKGYLNEEQIKKIQYTWDNDFRVPQELINYEYLLKVRR